MDFARKQLEKYGWKEGGGLGKEGNEGISRAIKPQFQQGKQGMGYELGKELTDTWWTRSYDDSLNRINVDTSQDDVVRVSTPNDGNVKDTPLVKMRKRMMKSNFTEFSKGGTLDQGKLVSGKLVSGKLVSGKLVSEDNSSSSDDDSKIIAVPSKITKLNDDDLLKACGGRTAHKAARFGHKLSGKLARLQAQEKYLMEKKSKSRKSKSSEVSEPL